jgi:membrane associated rhomboid family serine protease/Zn-finger nucleic acid-binding protein
MLKVADHGVVISRCRACHGVFYPAAEVQRALGGRPQVGTPTALSLEGELGSPCPGCGGTLEERRAKGDAQLLIDVCKKCGGIFLDKGELPRLAELTRRVHSGNRRAVQAALEDDTRGAYARGITAMAGSAARNHTQLESSPGILRTALTVLGLPVDDPHYADRPAWLIWGLITLLTVIFMMQVSAPDHFLSWALVPSVVLSGRELKTVLSSMLIHGNALHLIGNAYMLWMAGDNLEARMGSMRTLLLFVVAGLVGSAAVLASDPHGTHPYLGASGAIAGFLGAYVVLFPGSRVYVMPRWVFISIPIPAVVFFLGWFAMQFFGVWSNAQGVAYWAHIGGFVAGLAAGWLAKDRT